MSRVVVNGTLDSLPPAQLLEILNEKIRVKCVGMVIIELRALIIAHIMVRLVIIIVIHDAHISAEMLHYLACDGGFSASRAACDTDYDYVVHPSNSPGIFYLILMIS